MVNDRFKHYIRYAGKDLNEFGLVFSGNETHGTPSRDISNLSVPGKNGDITIDNGRWNNINVVYRTGIKKPVEKNLQDLRNFLMSQIGYQRLEDSYSPDTYRLGVYTGEFRPTLYAMSRVGEVTLNFNCKPQRYLKEGENEIEITSSGATIHNPTYTSAKPLVRVYGTGTIAIGDQTIKINSSYGYTDIDCEIMDAFYGSSNCNNKITLQSGSFFTLEPGDNGITFTSGITKVIITPRWWIL